MSQEFIKIRGPYVLKVGQGLLQKGIFRAAEALEDLPRLPFFRSQESNRLSDICYEKVKLALPPIGESDRVTLLQALKEIGNGLIRFPNWLRYLHLNKNIVHEGSYDEQGRWVEQINLQGRTTQPGPRAGMDAALSYPYWAYRHQIKVGLIPTHEQDPSILPDARVTTWLEGNANIEEGPLGEREWLLLAAPKLPIMLPEKIQKPYDYKQKLMDGLGETETTDGSPHPVTRLF